MDRASEAPTSASLLARLRQAPADQQAWGQFVRRYGGQIYGWCRHWGLQEADAEDVTQAVLLRLAEKMRGFAYDPARSFRGWLRTLAQHAWSDYVEGRRRPGAGSGDSAVWGLLEAAEARDGLARPRGAEL